MTQSQRKNVFISYSHADKQWLERLKVHLKPLEREGVIDLWSDEKIQPSSNWKEEIRKALREAKVAVLLISADFLASEFIHMNELPPLLAAAEKEDAHILPVIVSRSSFEENESLSKYQAVNPPNKPLLSMSRAEVEDVFYNLYKSILSILRKREGKNNQKIGIESDKRIRAEEINNGITTTDMHAYRGNTDKRMRAEEQERDLAVPKIKLRSQPIKNLRPGAVGIMIQNKGFYDSEHNTSGTGFSHNYELQKDGKVVYDFASGLMWQHSGSTENMKYKKAKAYVDSLNGQRFAGYRDWRLPTLEEAMSLIKPIENNNGLYIDSIFDKTQAYIWTSDYFPLTFSSVVAQVLGYAVAQGAWFVSFISGSCGYHVYYGGGSFINDYVRAVR